MWICFNDAFVSAVQDKNDPNLLWVRARNRAHLETLFPGKEIIEHAGTDYACRVRITKPEFAELVAARIAAIDYGNFKNSVRDRRLHDLYADFWELHFRYQHTLNDRAGRFAWVQATWSFIRPTKTSEGRGGKASATPSPLVGEDGPAERGVG